MAAAATPSMRTAPSATQRDDGLTVCGIAALAFMLSDVLHQGLGHACTALLTVSPFGMLTSAGWSSAYDNTLTDVAGPLVNLAAAAVFWLLLRSCKTASLQTRLFLLLGCAFNLLTATGLACFSSVTGFGDWTSIIAVAHRWDLRRVMLGVTGALAYRATLALIGFGFVRYLGLAVAERRRIFRLTLAACLTLVIVSTLAALMNSIGLKFLALSDLVPTLASCAGLLLVRWYLPKTTQPAVVPEPLTRSWLWIGISGALAIPFILVLGRGITLSR